MDASEIYSERLNAKEVIFPKQGEFIFPIADGRIKTLGGDQDLRTSTLVRHRPIQGESNIDFLGEPKGSLPRPQDSFPDAREAISDVWSMIIGISIGLETCLILGQVSHNLLYWKKNLPTDMWSGWRLTRKQLTSRPDHLWPELWKSMGKYAKLKEKQKWSEELRGICFIDP